MLEVAAALVAERGRAMQECRPGAMLALGCDADEARELLAGAGLDLELAAVNGPGNCVVTGESAAIEHLRAQVEGRLLTRRMRTRRAFHSRLVEPAVRRLAVTLRSVDTRPAAVPIATAADGRLVAGGTVLPAGDFADQARSTVRFDASMATIAETLPRALAVDIGPGRVLSALAEAAGLPTVALGGPGGTDGGTATLTALGALWAAGQPVLPTAWCPAGRGTRLPGYPFAGPRWVAAEVAAPQPAVHGRSAQAVATHETVAAVEDGPAVPAADPATMMRTTWS